MIRLRLSDGRALFLEPGTVCAVAETNESSVAPPGTRAFVILSTGSSFCVADTPAEVADMVETALEPTVELTGSMVPL